jgi:ribosomal peptide maturation radical SAM protein 1
MPTDVCLVNMPYSSITTPSLALGLLETYIAEFGHRVETIHANMEFATKVGLAEYEVINNSFHECLLGEWTFSTVAFPEKETDDDAFFALFADISAIEKQQLLIIRAQTEAFIGEMAQRILAQQPKVVGCTSTFQQNCASLALLRKIKAINPNVITMMGGANCEGDMGQQISDSFTWVDYVFSGECDDVIGEFVDKLVRGDVIDYHQLPLGFIVQKQNPSINQKQDHNLIVTDQTHNKKTHIAAVNDMSIVGIPNYDNYFASLEKLDLYKYITPGLIVETSRGCWWGAKQHCTFCGLNGGSMAYRSKPQAAIVNELQLLSSKHKVTKFEMVDNIIPLEYYNTVVPELAEKHDYTFFYETKSNLKKEHLELFSNAGIKFIQPGIESLHDDFLKLVKKGVTAVQNVALLKWGRTFGVRVIWNLLSDAPNDKDQWYVEMADLLPLLSHLEAPCCELVKIRFPRFSPYFNNPAEYGLTLEPLKSYKYIYPLSSAEIENIAYFFDEKNQSEQGIYNVTQSFSFKSPALENLQNLVIAWRKGWSNSQPAIFCMTDYGDKIILTDTRPVATRLLHTLTGNEAEVYRLCAEPITRARLLAKIAQVDKEIDETAFTDLMEKLVSNNLVIYLSNCFFALAYNQDASPYLSMKEFPSGYVDEVKLSADRKAFLNDELLNEDFSIKEALME